MKRYPSVIGQLGWTCRPFWPPILQYGRAFKRLFSGCCPRKRSNAFAPLSACRRSG